MGLRSLISIFGSASDGLILHFVYFIERDEERTGDRPNFRDAICRHGPASAVAGCPVRGRV